MYYDFKLKIKRKDLTLIGEGIAELLKGVESHGSLRQAAVQMNMSYSQAWQLIKLAEDAFGKPLIERQIGGKEGGGSSLTLHAEDLLIRFKAMENDAENCLKNLFEKHFQDLLD